MTTQPRSFCCCFKCARWNFTTIERLKLESCWREIILSMSVAFLHNSQVGSDSATHELKVKIRITRKTQTHLSLSYNATVENRQWLPWKHLLHNRERRLSHTYLHIQPNICANWCAKRGKIGQVGESILWSLKKWVLRCGEHTAFHTPCETSLLLQMEQTQAARRHRQEQDRNRKLFSSSRW